jgi:hypothetical protein
VSDLLSGIWLRDAPALHFNLQQWELVLSQAFRASLLARLARDLRDNQQMAEIPSMVAEQLVGPAVFAHRQDIEVCDEVERIRAALVGCTDVLVLLKGAAYLVADLPPCRGRTFSDIDVMVRRDRLSDVESALMGAGWISKERDAYNQHYYRRWMHEVPPLIHVTRASAIDLHHTITPPTSRFRVDAELLFADIVPTRLPNVYTLSPVDMVLHSAVHLYQEGEFDHGLRDLLDLRDLLVHFGAAPEFWTKLLVRAEQLKLEEPLAFALFHLQRVFGYVAPVTFVNKRLGQWSIRHRVLNRSLQIALRPNHPSCDTLFTSVARLLLYMRSHWIRMPIYLLLPHLLRKGVMQMVDKPERES